MLKENNVATLDDSGKEGKKKVKQDYQSQFTYLEIF
jgi:hypothetical protein